jgi:hypothetical protein
MTPYNFFHFQIANERLVYLQVWSDNIFNSLA